MPTPRRSTGGARGQTGPSKGQSTISFAHRVTKSVPKDTKKDILSPSEAKVDIPAEVKPAKEEVEEPKLEEPEEEEEEEEEETSLVDPETHAPEKSEAELKAEKISDAQINKYWKAIEKERVAPRVHQQDLTVSEKVLRYFDVNSRFGPCVGIDRKKRWVRAERLGLEPPIEVLAVLLKESTEGNKDIGVAQIDKILNSSAVAA